MLLELFDWNYFKVLYDLEYFCTAVGSMLLSSGKQTHAKNSSGAGVIHMVGWASSLTTYPGGQVCTPVVAQVASCATPGYTSIFTVIAQEELAHVYLPELGSKPPAAGQT